MCVCVSISNSMAEKILPSRAPLPFTSIKLSESYSCQTVNEAHLQEQTVPSLSLSAVHTPRGPSLMRNSSVEISSISFGTNMHPKVWALCISLFGKRTKTHIYSEEMFVNPNSHIHLKPPEPSSSIAHYICHGFVIGPRQTWG